LDGESGYGAVALAELSRLGLGEWSYAGLLVAANVIVAAVVLIAREGS
jgi:hypothetical protein